MPKSQDLKGIIEKVAQIILAELKLEDITVETFNPDLDLIDELGIDSMDLATIALVLRDEYKMIIEDDYSKLKIIRLIADYVEEKISARSKNSYGPIPILRPVNLPGRLSTHNRSCQKVSFLNHDENISY